MNARGLQDALAERLPSAENQCVLAIDIENLGAYIDHHGRTHGEVAIQTVVASSDSASILILTLRFAMAAGKSSWCVCLIRALVKLAQWLKPSSIP